MTTKAKKTATPPARKTARRASVATPRSTSPASVQRRLRLIENKRGAILQAALGLFSRFGLHGTSLDQVAARADVSKSNLLYYFASKEELYVAVLRDLLALWLAPLKAFSAEQDPREAVEAYVRAKLVDSRDQPEASRLFCLEMVQGAPLLKTELEQSLRPLVEAQCGVIRQWVAQGKLKATVEPVHLIFALWATTQHYADFAVQVQAVAGKTLDDPAFFEEAVAGVQRLVLDGIVAAPKGRR
jgi:TetR/AcrR family transcriptional regulator